MEFKFKQFAVKQARSAMKIGTDSVLLGAWTPLETPESILDIGAGTGVLALMMAQRSSAQTIDAIEIEEASYIECIENFEESPWGDRLFCYHCSFEAFVAEVDTSYDLIISNPPFYTSDYKSPEKMRNRARFEESLPFDVLLNGVDRLLSKKGVFSVIIPYTEVASFVALAALHHLFPMKLTHTYGHIDATPKRSLIAFSRVVSSCEEDSLVIERERGVYTEAYVALTKEFYYRF